MVSSVEVNSVMQTPGNKIGPHLPEIVIELQTSLKPSQTTQPLGQGHIVKVYIREGFFPQRLLDTSAALRGGQNIYLIKPAKLFYHVPTPDILARAEPGTAAGVASISGR
jgi:hypothetical protein